MTCGVKKPAMQQNQQTEKRQSFITPSADNLSFPDNHINDSTIHINYTYGIPFIIDDSVPMLLPPIDKKPVGYVSNQAYYNREQLTENGYVRVYCNDSISACGLTNPLVSLLWLNKCINDIQNFKNRSCLPISHSFLYNLFLYTFDDGARIFIFIVSISPYWSCIADETPKKQMAIYYTFDCDGSMLGKTYANEPVEWKCLKNTGKLDKHHPNAESIISLLEKKTKRFRLFTLSFVKFDPNYDCPDNNDVIRL